MNTSRILSFIGILLLTTEASSAGCDPDPCLHGGRCVADGDDYTCECPTGKGGVNCHLPECMDGWNHSVNLRQCYEYECENDQNLAGAAAACAARKEAIFVSPMNAIENNFIFSQRTDTSKALILGIKYDKTDGNYKTREGETVTYFNWAEGEPDGESVIEPGSNSVSCIVQKIDSAEWADETCMASFSFICKKDDYSHLCSEGCSGNGECVLSGGDYSCQCRKNFYGDKCEHECGGQFTMLHLLFHGKTIVSPDFPNNYPNSAVCEYTVAPFTLFHGNSVKLEFTTSFHLESQSNCDFDYVAFYDESSSTGTLLGKFCGYGIPSTVIQGSSGKNVVIKFVTDQINQYGGFEIVGTRDATHPCENSVNPCGANGGRCVADGDGYICQCSVGIGGSTCESTQCEDGWYHSTCTQECHKFGGLTDSNLAGAISNCEHLKSSLPTPNSEHDNNVIFQERKDLSQPMLLGIQKDTSGVYTWIDGTELTWTNWAEGEPNSLSGKCIVQKIDSAEWEAASCFDEFTFICVKETYVHLCPSGKCLNGGVCVPEGEHFACQCRTNFYGDQCELECGGSINFVYLMFSVTTLTSPDYPANYPLKAVCEWTVTPVFFLANNQVKLKFDVLDIEPDTTTNCAYDSLTFYDGPSTDNTKLGTFCGTDETTASVEGSAGTTVLVRLVSDQINSFAGFSIVPNFDMSSIG